MPFKSIEKSKEHKKKYAKLNAEKISAYQKLYRQEHKTHLSEQYRLASVKRLYNLDAEQYLQMIHKQENKCAICFQYETAKNRSGDVRPLCVDHDHVTGEVRALLCNKCNACLGHVNDNVDILQNAINYLKSFTKE
jgi:Recombination endonuclease VII